MRFNKIIIAVKFEPAVLSALKEIKKCDISELTEIHLVHIVPMIGDETQDQALLKTKSDILKRLNQLSLDVIPGHEKKVMKCIFDTDAKQAFNSYVKSERADLSVIPVRENIVFPGVFESSFAHFLIKHSNSSVLLLKDRNFI